MNRIRSFIVMLLCAIPALTGCSAIGKKASSITVIYSIAAILAALMLVVYFITDKKKSPWFTMLFICVFVVNSGYYMLSVSKTLEQALWANRLSYAGSVLLPLSMLMIILHVTKTAYKKWIPALLLCVAAVVFLIAASPGYSGIYYREVSLKSVNGATALQKVYGPLHIIYLFYLLFYFSAMITAIVYVHTRKLLNSTVHALMLTGAVFVNLGVWFIEQLVSVDFEILSLSYIICELFLLGLNVVIREYEKLKTQLQQQKKQESKPSTPVGQEQIALYKAGMAELTPTERTIYNMYVQEQTTKQIMLTLNITENTLKFHNKNIYSKLGVSSRKQLMAIYKQIE